MRWDIMQNVSADGVSPSLPHLKGLQNGDMATSRIKQVCLRCLEYCAILSCICGMRTGF